MSSLKQRCLSLLSSTCIVAMTMTAGPGQVLADDTEIFVGSNNTGVKPNILFVLDTSGSMDTEVVVENAPYNPLVTYAGSCNASRVYWLRNTGGVLTPPGCGTDNYFNLTAMQCKRALDAFPTAGKYDATDAAQYDSATDTRWEQIRSTVKNEPVECRADEAYHGNGGAATYATDRSNIRWTTTAADRITWTANGTDRDYVFYTANYLNWYNNPVNVSMRTRLEIMQDVVVELLGDVTGVNVGLMRYSHNANNGCGDTTSAEGGMVTFPMSDVDAGTARNDLINTVKSYTAAGCTPLSETLYEAALYLTGGAVDYGNRSRISPTNAFLSVPASRDPGNTSRYKSPMVESCQKSYIVYLTDGLPTSDTSANAKIEGLPGFQAAVGSSRCDGSGEGHCLDDLAAYLHETDLNTTLSGKQNVVSHWIGFGPEVSGSALLQTTANRGGGRFYSADNTDGLAAVLTTIVTEILQVNTSFTAPSVSVNAFNRTQTLSDLYVSVFRPQQSYRWPGNIKKYRITGGEIRDADGLPAVNPDTGFFKDSARSFWSASGDPDDGQNVEMGGAASRQPADPNTRKVYTNIAAGNPDLTATGNLLQVANAAISDAVLGVGGAGQPARADLIEWTRGRDVQDKDGDNNVTEARRDLGDPMHAKPAVVIYGGSVASPDAEDAVVFAPTNDGMLHAIDVKTGNELWSFMPADLLDGILELYLGTIVNDKHYGLDSEIRVLKYDVNQNGVIEPSNGDKVHLYFGQGRGGSNYYGLDVTNRNSPRHLWTLTSAQLPGIGQTWSAPVVSRVDVSGAAQNSQKLVLIFAGGYDETQDNYTFNTDTSGNSIYMVDAVTGSLLWRGSNSAGANTSLARMVYSIPATVAVLDLDGDTFADRMYVGDMGGQLWRFDVFNGNAASSLVTGGVIADLGAHSLSSPRPLSATRRLYNSPDVALMRRRGKSTFFNIALGSGYRGHPLDDRTEDRFYAVRDYLPFTKRTQAQYDSLTPIVDSDLVDTTDTVYPSISDYAAGWKLELRWPSGWVGEKVLAESRTFNNTIFFPTYLPNQGAPSACSPAAGRNRVYVINAFDSAPILDLDGDNGDDGISADPDGDGNPNYTADDRFSGLEQSGIAPETIVLFPGRNDAGDDDGDGIPNGDDDDDDGDGKPDEDDPVVCLNGAEILEACSSFNSRIRTFWRESAAN